MKYRIFLIVVLCGILFSALQASSNVNVIQMLTHELTPVDEYEFSASHQRMIAEFDSLMNVALSYEQAEDIDQLETIANGIRLKEAVYFLNGAIRDSGPYIVGVTAFGLLSCEGKIGLFAALRMEEPEEKWTYASGLYSIDSPEPVVFIVEVDSLLSMFSAAEKEQAAQEEIRVLSYEAQQAITQIRKSYDIRLQTYGEAESYSFQQAFRDADLDESVLQNWTFSVVNDNYPRKYIAVSTSSNPAGEGKIVWYDVREARFHGLGIDDWEYQD